MAKRDLPSPDVLRQLLRYEPETGKLFWRERDVEWFDGRCGTCAYWNRRYAGKEALAQIDTHGYAGGKIFKVRYLAHRIIWMMVYDELPPQIIDHINGDKIDNRVANLRPATNAQNIQNGDIRSSNTSGAKGVTWSRHNRKWQAQIGCGSSKKHIGYFTSVVDAAAAYDRVALELFGEFARTNEMVNVGAINIADARRQAGG